MANEVTAAKKAAVGMDKAGILEAIKKAYPGSDVFGDDVLAGLAAEALSGGGDAPADPMMPGAAKPEAPAVPFASAKAEDVVTAGATAQADELKKRDEQIAAQDARIKALEGRELSGKIINASAADRKPAEVLSFADRIRTQRNTTLGAAVSQ